MPSHKKHPLFLRVITNKKQVLCVNPLKLSTFQILEKAKIKVKPAKEGDPDFVEADTIRFYFPSGTGLTYSVGLDITQQEFDYVCSTLLEFLYLNQAEFDERTKLLKQEQMEDWNKLSAQNEENLKEQVTDKPTGT